MNRENTITLVKESSEAALEVSEYTAVHLSRVQLLVKLMSISG